jgi:hypothetical protein
MSSDATGREASSTAPPSDLDAEYLRAVTDWREEMRWNYFLLALQRTRDPNLFGPDRLDLKEFDAILDDIMQLDSGVSSTLLAARFARYWGGDADEAKRVFVEGWRDAGPKAKEARVRAVMAIMENVLKSTEELNSLKKLDEEFPNEPIKDPDMKGLYDFLQSLSEDEVKEVMEWFRPRNAPLPSP